LTRTFHLRFTYKLIMLFYVFMSAWLMEFLASLDEFVIAYAAQRWYGKNFDSSGSKGMSCLVMVRGYLVALFYHAGSLAYGSFLILVLRPITVPMSIFKGTFPDNSHHTECMEKCISQGCCCLVQLWEDFLRFFSKDAFLMVAVDSVGFCEAAIIAVNVVDNEISATRAVKRATLVFEIGSLISITGGCAAITWISLRHVDQFSNPKSDYYVDCPEMVTAMGAIVAFYIALSFTMMFEIVANTLLFSWALDSFRSDPSEVSVNRRGKLPDAFEHLLEKMELQDADNNDMLAHSSSSGIMGRSPSSVRPLAMSRVGSQGGR